MNTLYLCGVTNHYNFIDCVNKPVITPLTMILACYSCDNHGGFSPAILHVSVISEVGLATEIGSIRQ